MINYSDGHRSNYSRLITLTAINMRGEKKTAEKSVTFRLFGTWFQREVPHFEGIPEFPDNTL